MARALPARGERDRKPAPIVAANSSVTPGSLDSAGRVDRRPERLTYQRHKAKLEWLIPIQRADGIADVRGAQDGRFQLVIARAPHGQGEGNETLRRSKNDMAAVAGNV